MTLTNRPRRVLIIAAEDLVIRNTLDTSVWDLLQPALSGVVTTLIVPKGRSTELRPRFEKEGVVVREFTRSTPSRLDALVATLLYAGLSTHTNHWSKMRALLRGEAGFLATYAKRLHAMTLARIHTYQRLLRHLYLLVGKDKNASVLFDDVDPSLVISLSATNFDTDVVLMREAKRRGIRVVGMTRSWDNLTSHGALRVVPDHLIVQNEFLKDAARGVQGISERDSRIDVVGLPHYDTALGVAQYAGTRDAFCQDYGLDPKKKILLYGAMGTFLFQRENDLIPLFSQLVTEGAFGPEVQLLYRPHPKFTIPEDIGNSPGVIIDRTATYRTKQGDERSASEALFRTIYHADVVLTAASTFAIDAALLDKPVACVNFDGTAHQGEVRYWESVNRFFDSYTHFEELVAQQGARVARNEHVLAQMVSEYLSNPALDAEGRARIVARFVGNLDGHAGERLARALATELEEIGRDTLIV